MHIHTAPDVTERKCSDLELVERFRIAGLAGALIKCHYADTSGRALLLDEQASSSRLKFFGGIVLNNFAGGINPFAVEASAKMKGKIVWFPTMDARSYLEYRRADTTYGIYILDENDCLISEAIKVLETAKKYNMLVGTGHMSSREGMALVRTASEIGCQVILTHADNPADFYSTEQQIEAAKLGAIIEHSYFTIFYKRTLLDFLVEQIRAVGVEHVILSSDFGQPNSPYLDEGLEEFARILLGNGFNESELGLMFRDTPAKLLGI